MYCPFSTPPPRTGLTSFQVSGSPVTYCFCSWLCCLIVHAEYPYDISSRRSTFSVVERPSPASIAVSPFGLSGAGLSVLEYGGLKCSRVNHTVRRYLQAVAFQAPFGLPRPCRV